MDKVFKPENMARLDSEERRKLVPPEKVLDLLMIRPGDTFLDAGAGIGYFSFPALTYTGPRGRVIAADISPVMADEMKRRAPENAGNLEIIVCPPDSIPLEDASADRILLAFMLHEMDGKREYLREMLRILKPGGTMGVAEWEPVESPMGPPIHERLGYGELEGLIDSSRMTAVAHEKINPYQYVAVFRKSG